MPLYEIAGSKLRHHPPATFARLGVQERADLQRLLRDDIGVIDDGLMVIAEEFGEWEDARRRIDLLAVEKTGRLVVIELKRTESGGHMELQALRYAAMVSSMGFDDIVAALTAHLTKVAPDQEVDARAELLAFLDAQGTDEAIISSEVRVVLVSADFGRELMTTVLWLNRFDGMDIRCVRLVPYTLDGKTLLDIQQVVPFPEAADYQVRIRRKEQERERAHTDNRDLTRYHVVVDARELPDENKRHAVRIMVQQLTERGVSAAEIAEVLGDPWFRSVEGEGLDRATLVQAFQAANPRFNSRHWFLDYPIEREGRTWLLKRQWGRNTEPALTALSEAFPAARLGFRRAED